MALMKQMYYLVILYRMVGRYGVGMQLNQTGISLSSKDVVLITYADMVKGDEVGQKFSFVA